MSEQVNDTPEVEAIPPASAAEVAAAEQPPAQPPVDNEHVAEGATPFDVAPPQEPAHWPIIEELERSLKTFGGQAEVELKAIVNRLKAVL